MSQCLYIYEKSRKHFTRKKFKISTWLTQNGLTRSRIKNKENIKQRIKSMIKFKNEPMRRYVCHIFSQGKGKNTEINIRFLDYSEITSMNLSIEEAKEMVVNLNLAIQQAEANFAMKEKDEEDDNY